MKNFKIQQRETFINYSWSDKLKGRADQFQQISLSPTGARNRGNYIACFDVVSFLYPLKSDLANYYFDSAIAALEVEAWAQLISKTIDDKIINIEESNKLVIEDNPAFTVIQIDKLLKFKSDFEINIFAINAVSKTELFIIDGNDLFSRHYLYAGNRSKESDSWIDTRKQD